VLGEDAEPLQSGLDEHLALLRDLPLKIAPLSVSLPAGTPWFSPAAARLCATWAR
jgi:hypothetical protein